MCNHCDEDPRDIVHNTYLAVTGLTDMLLSGTEPIEREGLAEVLYLIQGKLKTASMQLRHYTPNE